jgi:hypothetical protein
MPTSREKTMNGKFNMKLAAVALTAVVQGVAYGQQINVTVDGDPVVFTGVGPRQVNGRVMVPLRGVMEKLGAFVGWEPRTQTVTANKSGVDLVLRLGDRNAVVNGRTVILDVPAEYYRGSTMVPLRFVGEALGADVKWNAATYTVNITTTTGGANPQIDPNQYTPPRTNPPVTPPVANVSITSFDVDHSGTIRGGEEIRLSLVGTPGGEATFSIPGVIENVLMTETQPGVYVGTFKVPSNSPVNISKASAVARLRIGRTEKLIQSGTSLGFDTQAPAITAVTPDPNTRVGRDRPNISATFDDSTGSGIDPASVEVRLDNRNVTRDAQVTSTFMSYRPDTPLTSGTHEVTVTARDRAGNVVNKSWSFRVTANSEVIRSFTYDSAGQPLLPGTDVTFTLVGEPGATATFSVGDRVRDRRMREVEPGRYQATYTIRRNDNFEDVPVTAKLLTASGDTFTYEAQTRFTATSRTLEAPSFTEPVEGATAESRQVFRGRAAPGSHVQIKIDYSKNALGVIRLTGTVAETEVIADDQGRWVTDPINMSTGLGSGPTTFTVTAITIGANGKKSSETKLTLRR